MNTKEELKKTFTKLKSLELEMLFAGVTVAIDGNCDLEMATRDSDLYEEEKEDFPDLDKDIRIDEMFSDETLKRYRRVDKTVNEYKDGKKFKKAEFADVLADIFTDEALTESFLMTLPAGAQGETIRRLFEGFGLQDEFEHIMADDAFRIRRDYFTKLYTYAKAAVNLYGSLSVFDLLDIIRHYNRRFLHQRDYQKPGKVYPYTVFYSPKFLNDSTLHELCDGSFPGVRVSADGLVLHRAFAEELNDEMEEFIRYVGEHKNHTEEKLLEGYFDGRDTNFRRLYFEAVTKVRYLPSESVFVEFADPESDEWDSGYEDKLETFILGHYDEKANKNKDLTAPEDVADEIIYTIRDIFSDHNSTPLDVAPTENIQEAFDLFNDFGVRYSEKELNDIVQMLMNIANNTRLWANNGHTPSELSGSMSGTPTIVPGSSAAADMLSGIAPKLNNMGMDVDLTPAAVSRTGKKIYPNDPCPCGSGKKYKYCHGRKKK